MPIFRYICNVCELSDIWPSSVEEQSCVDFLLVWLDSKLLLSINQYLNANETVFNLKYRENLDQVLQKLSGQPWVKFELNKAKLIVNKYLLPRLYGGSILTLLASSNYHIVNPDLQNCIELFNYWHTKYTKK